MGTIRTSLPGWPVLLEVWRKITNRHIHVYTNYTHVNNKGDLRHYVSVKQSKLADIIVWPVNWGFCGKRLSGHVISWVRVKIRLVVIATGRVTLFRSGTHVFLYHIDDINIFNCPVDKCFVVTLEIRAAAWLIITLIWFAHDFLCVHCNKFCVDVMATATDALTCRKLDLIGIRWYTLSLTGWPRIERRTVDSRNHFKADNTNFAVTS